MSDPGQQRYGRWMPWVISAAEIRVAISLVGADYFLEDPIYSLVDNDLREFGDLGLVCTFGCNCDQSYSRIGATPHKNP